MQQIGYHTNVLGMIGFWTRSEPFLLLLEYVPRGDLLNWLREKRKQVRFAYCCGASEQQHNQNLRRIY